MILCGAGAEQSGADGFHMVASSSLCDHCEVPIALGGIIGFWLKSFPSAKERLYIDETEQDTLIHLQVFQ